MKAYFKLSFGEPVFDILVEPGNNEIIEKNHPQIGTIMHDQKKKKLLKCIRQSQKMQHFCEFQVTISEKVQ